MSNPSNPMRTNVMSASDFDADYEGIPSPELPLPPQPPELLAESGPTDQFGVITRIIPATTQTDGLITYGVSARISRKHPTYALKVQHQPPSGIKIVQAEPMPTVEGGKLFWNIGDLEAGKEFRIKLVVKPRPGVELAPNLSTTFHAIYSQVVHLQTPVIRPKINVTISGPTSVRVGTMARFGIDISNTGNATIKNETLRVDLPANLSHPDGNRLKIPLDPIAPGEVLQVAFQVRAEKAGPFLLSVDCEGQSHGRSGEVIAPVLQAEIDAPQRAIVREPIQGLVFLRNLGTAAAEQVQARLILPEGCEVLNNEESIYDSGRKELLWSLPLLEPKESLRLPFTIKAEVPGEGRLQLRVSASDASILSEHHLVFDFNPNLGARPLDQFLQSMADKMLPGQLPQLEKPASRKDATQATGSSFIVFSASRTLYAVSLASVIEVARARSITPVPNLPSWMLGISAIRGDMVSVLHLGSFFGQEGQSIPTEARVLVLNTQNKEVTVAVLVDRVRGLRTVEMEEIRPFPENLTHPVAEYALGVSEIEDQLVVLLDVDKLLLSPNLLQFQAA